MGDLWLGRAIRVCLVIDLLAWAGVLARPGATFAGSHSYDLMAAWASEDHWAAGFAIAALHGIWGFRGRAWWRLASLMPVVAAQGAIAVSFGGGPSIGTGFGTHLAMAVLGLILCPWEWWRG
jgi:hypothetical protein